ncbi:S1/P1 nuclease, partial [Gilvibacter sp.]|uniref:S1/P1 nuclease n=1 Tax=Gilvibacter sp. TaxID=2729997 RepID=UPI003F4A70FE
NRFQVQWFDEGTNLHRIWDTTLLEYYKMSYTELAATAPYLSTEEIDAVAQGTHYDWMRESRAFCEDIYANTKVGANLKYRYAYIYMDKLRMQLHKGGIRLAMILNEVFA